MKTLIRRFLAAALVLTSATLSSGGEGRVHTTSVDLVQPSSRVGLGCAGWVCGANSPVVDGAAIKPAPSSAGGLYERALASMAHLLVVWGQNLNSPVVDGAEPPSRAFHELNVSGLPNSAGLSVVGVHQGTAAYSLEVVGARVSARPKTGTAPVLSGAGLVGLALDLTDQRDAKIVVAFAGVSMAPYWAGPAGSVSSYSLTYMSAPEGTPQPLCTAGINEAILFSGDRYDGLRKTVTATGAATRGWVNIACARTALAKMFLVRHTEASQIVETTAAERQAMLKMFTADVCGDGTAFTVPGQPLLWRDAKGITAFNGLPATFEAVWSDHGAVCLDQPRRPELAAAIAAHCGPLPRCTAQTRGHVTSANPK